MIEIAPVDPLNFHDGYIRTFRQKEIPELSPEESEMLYDWYRDGKTGEIVIYLTLERYLDLDEEMAEFVLREIMRENI